MRKLTLERTALAAKNPNEKGEAESLAFSRIRL